MRLRACVAGLLLAAVAGCWFARPSTTSTWLDRLRPFSGPAGPDVVILEIAILEVPVGDTYVNQEMWTGTDEQFLPPEIRSRQEENGLRVALVHGRPPDRLQSMLSQERHNRNARQRRLRGGNASVVDLGGKREQCSFELRTDDRTQAYHLNQALCQWQLTPTIEKNGKISFRFVPQVQYYDKDRLPSLSATSILPLQDHRVTDSLPAIKFDVAVTPNEWIIVGARFDKPKSLGFQFFIESEGDRPVQRLLILRATRADGGGSALQAGKPDGTENPKLSLASQASAIP